MTASPSKVNGAARPPAMQVLGDWQPIQATPTPQADTPTEPQQAEPHVDSDLVAQAKAEAIRAQAWAESEERRLAAEAKKEVDLKLAEAEAEAIRTRAEEEARKTRLANDRAERKSAEEQAASEARIADHNRRRDEANRARDDAARKAEEQQQAEEQADIEVAEADNRWRSYALNFYRVCAIVALPVQVAAFYNPKAIWLMAAPLMLEGGAWVVLKGAAAAVANRRPSWHYRLIAWLLAFIAAAINLWHGLNAFDPATAIGTAFASIAGPGVWDLHEHGRIRKRDGVPTRRERRAAEKEAERLAAEQAEKELREAERQAYREKATRESVEALDEARRNEFPDVHRHALKLAADFGETGITESIWKRAKLDVHGALPGESADVFRMRNAAEARVAAAREKRSVNGSSQQVASQMPGTKKPRVYNPPARRGVRAKGDTPKYSTAARKQAAITAQQAAKNPRPNDN